MVKRFIPHPGDLILVELSEWYALGDGEELRVCEHGGFIEEGVEIRLAPRRSVSTFWGPSFGPPGHGKPMHMSTSGGPFKTAKIKELEGLTLIGEGDDTFWHWEDSPKAGGGVERIERVALWRLPVLKDSHYRELVELGLPTHRDRKASVQCDSCDCDTPPWED